MLSITSIMLLCRRKLEGPRGKLELHQDTSASRSAHLEQRHRHLNPNPEDDLKPADSSKQSQFTKSCSLINRVWLWKNMYTIHISARTFLYVLKFFLTVFSRANPGFFKGHGLGLAKFRGSYLSTHNSTSFHKFVICNITISYLMLSANRETQREVLKMKSNQAGRFHRCPPFLIILKLKCSYLIGQEIENI